MKNSIVKFRRFKRGLKIFWKTYKEWIERVKIQREEERLQEELRKQQEEMRKKREFELSQLDEQ